MSLAPFTPSPRHPHGCLSLTRPAPLSTSQPSSCLSSSSPSSTSATSSSRCSTRRSWKTCATPLRTGVSAPTTSSTSPHLRIQPTQPTQHGNLYDGLHGCNRKFTRFFFSPNTLLSSVSRYLSTSLLFRSLSTPTSNTAKSYVKWLR